MPEAVVTAETVETPNATTEDPKAHVVDPNPHAPLFPPGHVLVTAERLEQLRQAEIELAKQAEEARKQKELEQLKRGEYQAVIAQKDEAIRQAQEKITLAETRTKNAAIAQKLAEAISKHAVLPTAVSQLKALWAGEFHAVETGAGEFVVADRDNRPIEAVVAERMKSADYLHFLKPSHQGGTPMGTSAHTVDPKGPEKDPRAIARKLVGVGLHNPADGLRKGSGFKAG